MRSKTEDYIKYYLIIENHFKRFLCKNIEFSKSISSFAKRLIIETKSSVITLKYKITDDQEIMLAVSKPAFEVIKLKQTTKLPVFKPPTEVIVSKQANEVVVSKTEPKVMLPKLVTEVAITKLVDMLDH